MILGRYKDTSDRSSRYRILRRLRLDDGTDRIETFNRILIEERQDDVYHKVKAGEENRLDLISYKYYNNPLFWWVIAIASNIYDPFNVPVGIVLRVPAPSTLFSLSGVLGDA